MTLSAVPFCPPTLCLKPEDDVLHALRLMLENEVNHLPVCSADGLFAGVVSTNRILEELIPASARVEHGLENLTFAGDAVRLLTAHLAELGQRTVSEFAHKDQQVLEESCPILEAALLLSRDNHPLPVVTSDGKLRGMLSRRKLLGYLLQQAGL